MTIYPSEKLKEFKKPETGNEDPNKVDPPAIIDETKTSEPDVLSDNDLTTDNMVVYGAHQTSSLQVISRISMRLFHFSFSYEKNSARVGTMT